MSEITNINWKENYWIEKEVTVTKKEIENFLKPFLNDIFLESSPIVGLGDFILNVEEGDERYYIVKKIVINSVFEFDSPELTYLWEERKSRDKEIKEKVKVGAELHVYGRAYLKKGKSKRFEAWIKVVDDKNKFKLEEGNLVLD